MSALLLGPRSRATVAAALLYWKRTVLDANEMPPEFIDGLGDVPGPGLLDAGAVEDLAETVRGTAEGNELIEVE